MNDNRTASTVSDSARDYARRRVLARRNFPTIAIIWVVVSAVTTGLWFIGGSTGHFWPTWPILGVGIAVVAAAFAAYGPRVGYVSDADIDAEAARLTR